MNVLILQAKGVGMALFLKSVARQSRELVINNNMQGKLGK